MKNINKLLPFSIPVILVLLVLLIHFTKPVYVEMKILTVFGDIKSVPISECPVYWTYLDGHGYGTLYFDQNVKDYLDSYEYSNGALVISWGRPMHSLSYTRLDKMRSDDSTIGQPIFEAEETPSTMYVYQVQNTHNIRLISEYDRTLIYPEIEITK